MTETNKDTLFKLQYSDDETGWATRLGDRRARIENIPLSPDYRYLDVVRVEFTGRILRAGEVLERHYRGSAWVKYEPATPGTFQQIRLEIRKHNEGGHTWASEGLTRGFLRVNYPVDDEVAKKILLAIRGVVDVALDVESLSTEHGRDT